MSSYYIDQAFRMAEENGIEAFRAVVRGDEDRECVLPEGANAAGFLGIATHSQDRPGRMIAIRRVGFVEAIAAGAISAGSPLVIADDEGAVKMQPAPNFVSGDAGENNALSIDWIAPDLFAGVATIELEYPGGTSGFGWSFEKGNLVLHLSGADGEVTETGASLISNVASHPVLSQIISVSNGEGSNGTGLLEAVTMEFTNYMDRLNVIGIADSTVAQAGDRVRVLLNP